MSETLTLTAATLPPGFCPATQQEQLDTYADYLTVQIPDYYTSIVISDTDPAPADQDKVWLKLDGSGDPLDFFLYVGGTWTQINPPNLWVGAVGGVADAYTFSPTNYPGGGAPRTNDVFILKINAANTGACTLNLNASGAVSIKSAGSNPWAGALEANKWYTFVFDGTNYEVESIKQLTAGAITPGTNGQFIRTRGGVSVWESYYASGETAIPSAGNAATFTHGLSSVPIVVEIRLRCTDAGGDVGYPQNREVQVWTGYSASASNEDPAFSVSVSDTAIYAMRNSDAASIIVANGSTGSPAVAINESKWALVCYAIR